ncbi:MAG: MauE/DoxX family redox-associated membrane protein, partial [Massilia sp.]
PGVAGMNGAPFFADVLRAAIALVLLAAVVGKLRGAADFQRNLVESFGLAPAMARVSSMAMITIEGALALCLLLLPALAGKALAGALLLFVLLTLFLGYHYLTRPSVTCNCFGSDARPVSLFDLARNGALIAACALALCWRDAGDSAGHAVLALCLGMPLTLFAIHFHEIATALVAPAGER